MKDKIIIDMADGIKHEQLTQKLLNEYDKNTKHIDRDGCVMQNICATDIPRLISAQNIIFYHIDKSIEKKGINHV